MAPIERALANVVMGPTVSEELGPCVDSLYRKNHKGYPYVRVERKMKRISRLVLARSLGRPIGVGLCALHKCDSRVCIREDHI